MGTTVTPKFDGLAQYERDLAQFKDAPSITVLRSGQSGFVAELRVAWVECGGWVRVTDFTYTPDKVVESDTVLSPEEVSTVARLARVIG